MGIPGLQTGRAGFVIHPEKLEGILGSVILQYIIITLRCW